VSELDLSCDGGCPGGLVLCDGGQVCVSPSSPLYQNCSGSCLPLEAPCDGQCRDGSKLCGAECVDILNSTVMSCGGQCQPASLPCEGECSLGHGLCGDSCLPHTGDVWTCDGECVSAGLPCHSSCPTGRVLQDGACVSPADLCPEELQCLQDSDCQDGAACLLQGEKFYCQCRLGYTLQEPGLASCPRTGKCIEQSNLAQNCHCYSGDNVTLCLFCNATTSYSALTYQYTESLPDLTQIYRTEEPTCTLTVSLVCWYDVLDFVTDYNTVILRQTDVIMSSCSVSVDLVTPLACQLSL